MNTLTKSLRVAALISVTSASAIADTTANIGVVSDYFYRGIVQNTTATANGGIDYENGGFYVGFWTADVEDGLEVDLYGGYNFELKNGLGLSAGFTTYHYTGDFDDTYKEINLGASFGVASLEYSAGTYDNFDGPTQDYDFIALTLEKNGFYGKIGSFGDEFDGSYFELGYGTAIGGLDVGVALIANDEDLDLETGDGTETITFSLSKSFDL